jgi:hypothetical protein
MAHKIDDLPDPLGPTIMFILTPGSISTYSYVLQQIIKTLIWEQKTLSEHTKFAHTNSDTQRNNAMMEA